VIAHHDRKAESDDFVEKVSGSNGLAGAADTIVVLSRKRNEDTGLLQVTGRDVAEGEYAMEFRRGASWQLAGLSLQAAASQATHVRATSGVGDVMTRVIEVVAKHPDGIGPSEVATALGIAPDTVRRYLARAAETGRVAKAGRGLYTPLSEVSHVSRSGPDGTHETDGTGVGTANRQVVERVRGTT
jgi:hypothetical protein